MNIRFIFCPWCAVVLVAFGATASVAQPAILELQLNKNSYVIGEPVTVTFRLRPSGTSSVLAKELSFSTGLWLLYKHESETDFRPYADPLTKDIAVDKTEIVPLQGLFFSSFILHDPNRWHYRGTDSSDPVRTLFLAPGKYEFKARFRLGSEFVESALVVVNCASLVGEDVQAWNLWREPSVLATIHGSSLPDESVDAVQKLRLLVAQFPQSTYTQYALERVEALRQQGRVSGRVDHTQQDAKP